MSHVGTTRFQIYPAPGYGAMMSRDIRTVPAHPGLTGPVKHRNPVNGNITEQSACEAKPSDCPAFINGTPAQLLLDLAGADYLVDCPTCPWGVSLTPVGGVTETFLKIISLTRTSVPGLEKATVELVSGIGPGRYQIKIGSIYGAYAAQTYFVDLG